MSIYSSAVKSMPKLIRLECTECGSRKPICKTQAEQNLQRGWPECCGYTMRLITKNDIKEGRGKP